MRYNFPSLRRQYTHRHTHTHSRVRTHKHRSLRETQTVAGSRTQKRAVLTHAVTRCASFSEQLLCPPYGPRAKGIPDRCLLRYLPKPKNLPSSAPSARSSASDHNSVLLLGRWQLEAGRAEVFHPPSGLVFPHQKVGSWAGRLLPLPTPVPTLGPPPGRPGDREVSGFQPPRSQALGQTSRVTDDATFCGARTSHVSLTVATAAAMPSRPCGAGNAAPWGWTVKTQPPCPGNTSPLSHVQQVQQTQRPQYSKLPSRHRGKNRRAGQALSLK